MHTKNPLKCRLALIVCSAFPTFWPGNVSAGTLDNVRKRGHLICGVCEGLVGFSKQTIVRGWSGFDVDYCRAVAAAIFGDDRKVKFVALSASNRFRALERNQIDVLSRNTTWTMSRDVLRGFDFVGVWYFDFQGLLTRASKDIRKAAGLEGEAICALKAPPRKETWSGFSEPTT